MRARRWRLLALVAMASLILVGRWAPPAGASPDEARAPRDHGCTWEVYDLPDGSKHGRLKCPDGVDADDVPDDHKPPLPNGCREVRVEHGLGDQGPTMEVQCDDSVPLTDDSMEWVSCRDEHDYWFDDNLQEQIPRDAPQWWKDEIRIETEADEGRGCRIAQNPPERLCSQVDLQAYDSPGLLPDQCWGTYPSHLYEVSWSDGGMFDFENRMQGWTGSFMYNIGKGSILTALWLVGWAFDFDITEYTSFASNLAGSYEKGIVGPFGFEDIVWYTLIAWAGFTALRGKMGMAGGEILIAVVLAGLATVLFTNRTDYMNSVALLMDETSGRLLVAAQTERCLPEGRIPAGSTTHGRGNCREGELLTSSDPSRSVNMTDEIRPLQQRIHEAFVEQPYAYLNWGRVTTDRCLEAQNHVIGVGFNADGWPERHMARAGCDDEARFNRDQTGEKMLGAFLTMAASLVVAALLALMALTVLISKFVVALLFAIMPFAALGAILPGGARRMAWSWVGTLLQLVVAVVSMSFLLALMMLGVDEVLRTTRDLDLVERWFIVLLIVSCVYFGRRRVLSGSKSLAENFANTMTRLTPAGANSGTGNWGGVDFKGMDRGAGMALGAGAKAGIATLNATRRVAANRMAERRIARRGARNLERMERSRERPQLEYRHDGYRYHNSPTTNPTTVRAQVGGGQGGAAGAEAKAAAAAGAAARVRGGGSGQRALPGPGGARNAGPGLLGPEAQAAGFGAAGAAGAGFGAGGQGGFADVEVSVGGTTNHGGMARERWEIVHKTRAPRSALRHPIGHVADRIRIATNAGRTREMVRGMEAHTRGQPPRPGWPGWP